MIKKIVKILLLGIIIFGAVIIVNNLVTPDLQSNGFVVNTKQENPPDCNGEPYNCNDFTKDPTTDN